MSKTPLDHGHAARGSARAERFAQFDRIAGGEIGHPKIQMLARRRKGPTDATRVKQFLRIERGRLA